MSDYLSTTLIVFYKSNFLLQKLLPLKRLIAVFSHRLSFLVLAGWFVRGCLFGHPLTRFLIILDKFRGKPLRKDRPKRHPPMPPDGH